MNTRTLGILLILLAAAIIGWYFYVHQATRFPPEPAAVPETAGQETAASGETGAPPPPQHPVLPAVAETPSEPAAPPFPERLDDADAYLKTRLPQLIDNPELLRLLSLNHFIERLALIIDKLPGKEIPRPHLPVAPPKPGFLTTRGSYGQLVISGRNAARYTPYVKLAEALPDAVLLHLYRGLYPLFQQAYVDLGHPDGYFNDRLIQVIEHLLQTPEPHGAIPVVPHVGRFKYADETLESLSVGQKTLLRMGSDNADRVKARLRSLQQGLLRED